MTQGKGSSRPSTISKRTSSFFTHYHSFPTAPPPGRGKPPQNFAASSAAHTYPTLRSNSGSSRSENGHGSRKHSDNGESGSHHRRGQSGSSHHEDTPLPTKQLVVLAVIALSEQTALNSISPYLPDMAGSFPEVDTAQIGMYVGLIASSFALAQFLTNFFWGWVSDRVGRKPVILFGTLATAVCFVLFGYCRTLWQAVLVQMLMGLVNGNQGVVSTCLGEITDRTNQSKAFAYLPAIYGLGGITGPLLGGILVGRVFENYTYLLPNLVAAAILLVDLAVTAVFLKESNEGLGEMPPLSRRIGNLFARVWQFASNSTSPTYLKAKRARKNDNAIADDDEESDVEDVSRPLIPHRRTSDASNSTTSSTDTEHIALKQILTKPVILILITYLIFQLSNISYNSLYPVFAQGPPPTGRGLSSEEIGISLSFAGAVTILFQIGAFNKIQATLGNKGTYRFSLGIFVLAFFMMPWVGYADPSDERNGPLALGSGRITLWIELGFVLLVKTLASVGGLTSAMLLITNSAPTHAVLGTLNGLAQTLSAGGRAIGPFVSGGLFTLSTRLVKGEALAFGVFGAISAVGFLASWGIRAEGLEADEWSDGEDEEEDEEDEDEDER